MTASEIITLRDDGAGSAAKIHPGRGMNCFSFEVAGPDGPADLLWADDGFARGKATASSSGIPILFPFAGRLRGTEIELGGRRLQLEAGDGRGNTIHGLVIDRAWEIDQLDEQTVTAHFHAARHAPELLDKWPGDFRVALKYVLDGNGLNLDVTIENPDDTALPFGFGTHPYFRLPPGATTQTCQIHVPARTYWELDSDTLLPTGKILAADGTRDVRRGITWEAAQLDDVFWDLEPAGDRIETALRCAQTGASIRQTFDADFLGCVVYTPPHREAVCIEPYTCVPNAPELSGSHTTGWRELPAGASWRGNVRIEYEPGG